MLVIYLSSAKGKAHSFKTYSNKSFNAIIAHPCEHWSRGLCQSSLESKGSTLGNLWNSFSLLRESLCSVFAFSFFLLFFFFSPPHEEHQHQKRERGKGQKRKTMWSWHPHYPESEVSHEFCVECFNCPPGTCFTIQFHDLHNCLMTVIMPKWGIKNSNPNHCRYILRPSIITSTS